MKEEGTVMSPQTIVKRLGLGRRRGSGFSHLIHHHKFSPKITFSPYLIHFPIIYPFHPIRFPFSESPTFRLGVFINLCH